MHVGRSAQRLQRRLPPPRHEPCRHLFEPSLCAFVPAPQRPARPAEAVDTPRVRPPIIRPSINWLVLSTSPGLVHGCQLAQRASALDQSPQHSRPVRSGFPARPVAAPGSMRLSWPSAHTAAASAHGCAAYRPRARASIDTSCQITSVECDVSCRECSESVHDRPILRIIVSFVARAAVSSAPQPCNSGNIRTRLCHKPYNPHSFTLQGGEWLTPIFVARNIPNR